MAPATPKYLKSVMIEKVNADHNGAAGRCEKNMNFQGICCVINTPKSFEMHLKWLIHAFIHTRIQTNKRTNLHVHTQTTTELQEDV